MYLIAVLSLSLAVAVADPLGCCIPFRFRAWLLELEGHLGQNDTKAEAIDDMIEAHFDYNKRVQTLVNHRLDTDTGVRDNTTVIYDFMNNKMYILPDDGKCYTHQIDPNGMFHPCTAQNFTYGDSYTVGSTVKHFQINTFDGMLGSLAFSIAVTANGCYPVADRLFGKSGTTQHVMGFMFMDVDPNGVDDTKFNIPAICKPDPGATAVGKRDLEALRLKRRPLSYPS